ncbi:hypothetical protein H5410_061266 [Solanum commersonii]|uniref:Uncharacterized protein n=1 Tax=Solanum commersonii TaxID=4109 RepID=A0A9J5W8E1_SOLCO|nr:hypothetical protein H5410_061266 [Solanum commersonii]
MMKEEERKCYKEKKACGSPNVFGDSPNGLYLAQSSSVLSPEGKDQVSDEKEQWTCCEQFREAILYRPMIQNAKMLKARAERR